jgi:hypothetical protein
VLPMPSTNCDKKISTSGSTVNISSHSSRVTLPRQRRFWLLTKSDNVSFCESEKESLVIDGGRSKKK